MKAVVVTRHGDESVLAVQELPVPSPGRGEVLIASRAAGVNFADLLSRLGIYKAAPKPPFVPGLEAAGVIESVGEGVSGLKPGDRVMSFCRFGGYAEKVLIPASFAMRMPDDMTFAEGAAFPVQYLTAYHGLFHLAHVQKGESVLVHAAAGGVGIACLQLLRDRGVQVFATVGSESKAAVVREECPEARAILYREEDFRRIILEATADRGVDVVMDSVGGETFARSFKTLAPGGRHVLFGAASAVKPGRIARLGALWRLRKMLLVSPLGMIDRDRTLSGFNLIHFADRAELLRAAAGEMLALRAKGRIRPRVGLSLPLEKAAQAHRRMQERQTIGKVVLTVS